jgi:4'-phosphopantetheinyl transferase
MIGETSIGLRAGNGLESGWDLRADEVHVWRADLEEPVNPELTSVFSKDERERASRFHFERDRRRFLNGRYILRKLLGSYLGMEAGKIGLCYSAYGKPGLDGKQANPGLCFNVSHSGSCAMFAFSWERAVGVDIERIRADVETLELAERFFSPRERNVLRSLSSSWQRRAFFLCWTRKEAFVKAKGEGLSLALDQFDVSLVPDEPAEILETRPDPEERQRWSLWSLDTGPHFASALVVEGRGLRYTGFVREFPRARPQ